MRNLFLCLPVDSLDPAVLRYRYGRVVWDAGSETDCAVFHPSNVPVHSLESVHWSRLKERDPHKTESR